VPAVADWEIWPDMGPFERRLLHRIRRSRWLRILRVALDDQPLLYGGPSSRLTVHPTVWLNDAILNVASGTITFDEWSFVGSGSRRTPP
jgi:hypothetical protein